MEYICQICGKSFEDKYAIRKYCSHKCSEVGSLGRPKPQSMRDKLRKIKTGVPRPEAMKKKISKTLMGRYTRDKNPRWKGGVIKIGTGYVLLHFPKHPRAWGAYISKHQFIVESVIGRPVLKTEEIHHIDGNKSNNHPSNLYLFPTKGKHTSHHMFKVTPDIKSNIWPIVRQFSPSSDSCR